jgi:hypothetical protein
MRFQKTLALGTAVSIAGALLAGCSGTNPIASTIPGSGAGMQARGGAHYDRRGHEIRSLVPPNVGIRRLHLAAGPSRPIRFMKKPPKGGLYGSTFYGDGLEGYTNPNSSNGAPTCALTSYYTNGFGVDAVGNTMVPGYNASFDSGLSIYAGPYLCGTLTASIPDTGGQPADAYSQDSATGPIALGELLNYTSDQGDIELCTVSGSSGTCGSPLTNSAEATEYCYETTDSSEVCDYPYVAGVAIDRKGDCYASGYTGTSYPWTPALFYWPAPCTGDAIVASGVSFPTYGGLAIDSAKNVVITDLDGNLYVDSCKYTKAKVHKGVTTPPSYACTNLSTTTMEGESLFFGIGKEGHLVAGDVENGTVDVYNYSPSGSTYDYSFSNGLDSSDDVEAAADSPQMK